MSKLLREAGQSLKIHRADITAFQFIMHGFCFREGFPRRKQEPFCRFAVEFHPLPAQMQLPFRNKPPRVYPFESGIKAGKAVFGDKSEGQFGQKNMIGN